MKRILPLFMLLLSTVMAYPQGEKLEVAAYGQTIVEVGKPSTLSLYTFNAGDNPITRIDYWIECDGDTTRGNLLLEKAIERGMATAVNIPLPPFNSLPRFQLSVGIDSVNGLPNGAETKVGGGWVLPVTQKARHRVFIEEFTGTWCPNCPRGIVALEKLERLYGDSVVMAAIHNDDVMACKGYGSVTQNVEGLPYAFVDRWIGGDPYWGTGYAGFGMRDIVDRCLGMGAEATLDITKALWNEDSTAISLTTTSTFFCQAAAADYALGYVVTEDAMRGEGNEWYQANNLMNDLEFAFDDDFKRFYEGGKQIKNMTYNHVAVGGWKPGGGYDNCFGGSIEEGYEMTADKTLDISAINMIQDKSKIKVIALLIDRKLGRIANVAESSVSDSTSDALPRISLTWGQRRMAKAYQADGRLTTRTSGGLIIEQQEDGTVRKYLTK